MSVQSTDVPLILTEAGRQLAQRARDAEAKVAAIAALCAEVSDGAPIAPQVRAVLGEQPAGVLLTPDEARLAERALREYGAEPSGLDYSDSDSMDALAARLEATS